MDFRFSLLKLRIFVPNINYSVMEKLSILNDYRKLVELIIEFKYLDGKIPEKKIQECPMLLLERIRNIVLTVNVDIKVVFIN